MAGSSASLSFRLFGVDVSASRTIRGVGVAAERTSHSLGNLGLGLGRVGISAGLTAAKVTGAAAAVANVAAALAQAAPAAGLAAPALLAGAQAMVTLKLASDGVKASMAKFQPQLESLKTAAAKGIGPGLDRGMRDLMTNLPVVREGIAATARTFGSLAEEAGQAFSGPAFRSDLSTIMANNTAIIGNFGSAAIRLARAFVDVGVAAAPSLTLLSQGAMRAAESVRQWIAAQRASGALQSFIERGVQRVAQFGRIFINLGATLVNVFRAINTGLPSIDIISRLESISAWLRRVTAAGTPAARAISTFFTLVRTGAIIAKQYIGDAANAIRTGFQTGDTDYGGWIGLFEKIGNGARVLADKIRTNFWPVLDSTREAFADAFSSKQVTAGGTWLPLVQRMAISFRQLVDFIRHDLLPTLLKVGEFLIKDVLPPVMDIANAVRGVLLKAFSAAFTVIRNTVLPALQPLARILRDDVVPLVRQVAQWFQEHLIPAAQDLATRALKPLRGAFDSIRSAIDQNRPQLQAIFNVIKTLASFVLTVAAPVLGVVFGTSIRLMGQAMSISITIVGALVRAITGIVHAVQVVIGWFGRLGSGAANAVGTVTNWFRQLPGRIVGAVGSLGRILVGAGQAALRGLRNGAVTAWGSVGAWLRGIPNGIVRQVGSLGRILYNAGLSVLQGLWDGLKAKWESVKNWIGGIKDRIVHLKGPIEVDRQLLVPAGHAIMAGLDEGLRKGWAVPARFLSGVGAQIGGPNVGIAGGPVRPVGLSGGARTTIVNVYNAGSVMAERDLVATVRDGLARDKRGNGGRVGF